MNFLDFVKQKEANAKNTGILNEAFKKEDNKKVFNLILSLLKKNVDGKVLAEMSSTDLTINKDKYQSYFFYVAKNNVLDHGMSINFKVDAKTFDPYSISFYDEENILKVLRREEDIKAKLDINLMGASIIYYLPIIYHVLNDEDYSLGESKIKELAGKVYDKKVKESYHNFYIGGLTYHIFENIDSERLAENFKIKAEIALRNNFGSIMESDLESKKKELYNKVKELHKTGENKELEKALYKEYRQVLDAIKGGATSIDDLNISVKKDVKVGIERDKETKSAIEKFKKETKDPEQAFKEMRAYVNSVIKGLQPGVILCGAPGIGKTYRVLQQLKAKGYKNGDNLDIIKGKCTPRQLYLTMYDHKDKGEIILIDDADALVGPKAPEDVINILKGALDSTTDDEGGRTVSYKVSGDLKDDEGVPVPKRMSYYGSVIIITNYSVGQLDTALRGRVYTQSLDFTTEQLLKVIKDIIPAIEPGKLSSKAKMDAYEYLENLAKEGTDMEISIRTFGSCARLFQLMEDPENDLSEEDVKGMIKEQMENGALRGGKKY